MAKSTVGKKPIISEEEYTTNKVLTVFSVCLLGVLVLMILQRLLSYGSTWATGMVVTKVLLGVGVLGVIWSLFLFAQEKSGKRSGKNRIVCGRNALLVSLVMIVIMAAILYIGPAPIKALYVLLPVLAVYYLVYHSYQREFFVIAADCGTRISLCHTSSPAGVELIRGMRREGQEAYIESCVHYFEGSTEDAIRLGPWGKLKPPLRESAGLPRMRRHFAEGHIDMLGSDHAPFTQVEKLAEKTPDGLAAMELTLPMLLYRVKTGEFTLSQIAAYASERPAKIFGLYPHKGSLRPGADADIVLVDCRRGYTVDVTKLFTQAKDCARLYQGRETGGTIVRTLVRGQTVYENGRITAEPGWGTRVRP